MVDARIAKALGKDPQPDTKTTYPKEGAMWCPVDDRCNKCGKAKDECECDLCQKDRAKNPIQELLGNCDCNCDAPTPQPNPAPNSQPSTDLEKLISKLNGE